MLLALTDVLCMAEQVLSLFLKKLADNKSDRCKIANIIVKAYDKLTDSNN